MRSGGLKIDCEGAEYVILMSASVSTLSSIQYIAMEYHDNMALRTGMIGPKSGEQERAAYYSHSNLVEYLTKAGFEVKLRANPVHSHIGYLFAKNLSFAESKPG